MLRVIPCFSCVKLGCEKDYVLWLLGLVKWKSLNYNRGNEFSGRTLYSGLVYIFQILVVMAKYG